LVIASGLAATGLKDAALHGWLLEAYARCGRDGTVPLL
jgi:hypothetical protein